MSMKNSNDTIGNRTRDLPACRAVPQLTAPSRAPQLPTVETLFSFIDIMQLSNNSPTFMQANQTDRHSV
jgi:hypothetical protein